MENERSEMETKRTLLAIALSMAVLIVWQVFFPTEKTQPVNGTQPVAVEAPAANQSMAAPADTPSTAFQAQSYVSSAPTVTVDTPLYRAEFSTQGGILEHFTLKKFQTTVDPDSPLVDLITTQARTKAPLGLIYNGKTTWSSGKWTLEGENLNLSGDDAGTLVFKCEMSGVVLTREITFNAGTYLIQENLGIENTTNAQVQSRLSFTLASSGFAPSDDKYNMTRLAYFTADGIEEEADKDNLAEASGFYDEDNRSVLWAAILNNFFLLSAVPETTDAHFMGRYASGIYRIGVSKSGIVTDPASKNIVTCSYYLGPKDQKALTGMPNQLDQALNYGFFDFISKPLMWLLNFFYSYVGNYGVAIILLTVMIKLLFWPLSQKSYKSMAKMRKIQPMMTAIREKYKDDKQKMNQEMMQLYKTYKVNPAGGCLPMLLQIPVFFGLYKALLESVALRHQPFIEHVPFTDIIWLADLSTKDPFYVTPVIMGATMFLQQKLTPAPGDPTQAKIMMFMPVIFTFIFLNFPSGLVIYWLVNNLLSIAQQWWQLRAAD